MAATKSTTLNATNAAGEIGLPNYYLAPTSEEQALIDLTRIWWQSGEIRVAQRRQGEKRRTRGFEH